MAYTNVLALAADLEDFKTSVEQAARSIGFEVVGLEDAEPLANRVQSNTVDPQLLQLAEDVVHHQVPRFGAFYTWTSEDG